MSRSEEASDTLNLSSSRDPPRYTRPPMIPMSMACQGSTVAHPAVIETRPARIPLHRAPRSQMWSSFLVASTVTIPPKAAESVVQMVARAAVAA